MKTAVFLFVTRFGVFFFIKTIEGLTYQSIYISVCVQERKFITILVVLYWWHVLVLLISGFF